jgi:hypothetical protein
MTWRTLENIMHLSATPVPAGPTQFNPVTMDREELLRRYQVHGGLTTGEQLAHLLGDRVEQAISVVARWIVDQRVICFSLYGQLLLPDSSSNEPPCRHVSPWLWCSVNWATT